MPNFATASAFVDTATKCLATDLASPPRPACDQARADQAFVIVSNVVKVLEQIMNSVSEVAVVSQCLVRHDRPQIGATSANVHDVADSLASEAFPIATPNPGAEMSHSVEHGLDLRNNIHAFNES